MSSVLSLNQTPRYSALIPVREENVKAAIGAVSKLPEFAAELALLRDQVTAEQYKDFAVEFRGLTMDMDGFLLNGSDQYQYTKHALAQAVSRIKPEGVVGMAGYLVACPPDLRSVNYNFWHQDKYGDAVDTTKGNKVMLRVKNGPGTLFLRAVVSQSYIPIDDVPVLSSLGGIIPVGAHMRSVRGDIRSRFDLIWPTQQHQVRANDTIMVALRVINSETGASSVRLEPMVFHATTSSYFIIPRAGEDVAIRHIGEAKDRLKRAFTKVMDQIDPFIYMLQESYSDSFDSHFKSADQMWEMLGKWSGLPEVRIAAVKQAAQPFPLSTRYDVANAMVLAALDMDLDTAEELQRAAGLLVMNGWRPLTRFIREEE